VLLVLRVKLVLKANRVKWALKELLVLKELLEHREKWALYELLVLMAYRAMWAL